MTLNFDEDWEESAEETLSDVEYDTELGKELARDAQRLADGEITKEEFHERHHEDVVEEFGLDDRLRTRYPEFSGGEDPPGGDGPMPGVPGEDPNRRSVLKAAGALGAAAVGLGSAEQLAGNAAAQEESDDEGKRMGMAINTDRCIACLQCVVACNEENNNTADSLWMFVHRYEEDDYSDNEHFLTRPCQHCSDAPCVTACPTVSRFERDEDGIVLTDYDSCVGCRYCEVACPYGVNYLQWAEPNDHANFEHDREVDGRTVAGNPVQGAMGKCTFCIHRQDSGDPELENTTACEDICPVDAIHFGDLNDPESAPRTHLDELEDASTFRLLEDRGTEPNVIYIGNEPSPTAEPVEGPNTVDQFGLQRHRTGREEIPLEGGDEHGD
ncbi:MAG: 4Fe-4S ferredoxin N-terminal domain-containing protein [Haloferacaceae archaeon]